MREFDFLEPNTLAEALGLVNELGDECRVSGGGTAVILAMRQRILNPQALVSLGKLDELRRIHFDPRTGLSIGALARHTDIANSPLVREHYPVIASMAARLANPQVRNRGTIGGNLCYADPSTDPPSCLLAHGASVVIASKGGQRVLPMEEFLVDFFTTALEPTEILTAIRVPVLPADTIGRYTRHLRTAAEHRPLANVTFLARSNGGGSNMCIDPRITVGAAIPVAQRMRRAEEFLNGRVMSLNLATQAADMVADDIEPISDSRGDEQLRRTVVRTIVLRTIAGTFGLDWQGNHHEVAA